MNHMRAQKMWKLTQVRNDRTNDCPKNELVTEVTDMAEGEERFLGEKETTFFFTRDVWIRLRECNA